MARAFPASQPTDYGAPSQPGDWQALRGELEALLDQVEGQYAPSSGVSDAAFAGFAQRMQDLRYQVADANPDDRRREALRSVKRQIERFNERDEPEPVPHADNVLQSAIQQIRARTGGIAPSRGADPAAPQPAAAEPRFDQLSQSMAGLSGRLAQFESELKTQRGNAAQVKEIAEQVSQLSHVMELLAGAVGETGQVKRLESQIAGLAQMMTQAQKPDLTQMTERLDALSATVDRLADLQVQQIQHVVREAEAGPQNSAETAIIMHSIEESVRSIYDRLDRIESNASAPHADLDQVTAALAQISARLGSENGRPERLLSLVNALNSRINEVEDRSEGLDGLKGDIEALRGAIVAAIEPRFANIETRLGDLGERLQGRDSSDGMGMAQIEAQIRQLVARMDQTGEQLSGLAQLYSNPGTETPDFETLAQLAATRASETMSHAAPPPPDFDALADLVTSRMAGAMAQLPQVPAPDFEALADRAALRALAQLPPAPSPDFSALADQAAAKATESMRTEPATGRAATEAGLAEFEARITRLIDGLLRARPAEALEGVTSGMGRVEERLAALETALTRRIDAGIASARAMAASSVREAQAEAAPKAAFQPAASAPAPSAPPAAEGMRPPAVSTGPLPADDIMPRNPATEAPLKEFGFPDLGPVRAALEAKNGPRKLYAGGGKPAAVDPHFEMEPLTPEMAGGVSHPKPAQTSAETPPPDFDPAQIVRPPRPQSSLDMALPAIPAAPEAKAPVPVVPEVPASTRNTFIEAARRAAQRQNQTKPPADANSLMGRAFARFQPGDPAGGKPGKAETSAKAGTGTPAKIVTPEPAPAELPAKPSRKERRQLARDARGAAPALPEDMAVGPAEPRDASQQSFLVRYRRPILLGASLLAVTFMALNLVMQRLSTHEDQSAPAVVSTGQAPVAAPAATASEPGVPSTPAPAAAAKPDGANAPVAPKPADGNSDSTSAPKPVSEAVPLANPVTVSPVAAAPGPRIIATDPTTTASITPDAALNFAPSSAEAAMPPALAAANLAAATAPQSTATASIAPTDGNAAPAASTPVAMESPVKVEMPPANLGPEDLRQAAANGDAHAQFEIAAIYSEGRAVPQDFAQAEVWYERAAAQGFGPAQYRLGNLYENGKGVTKDLEQARLWYQRSAEAGNRMAMHNLAALYAGGQLGKQDFASAAEWFERAANLGMKDSQFNLGMLYARGLGVTQNLETSYKWFALAAATGDADAAKARDNIGRSLDAATIKLATAAVAAWKPAQIDLAANYAPIGTWDKSFNPGPTITDKAVITKVQGALIRLGYDIGTPNGHAGTKTADAIKAFERSTGMSEIGAINPRLLAVLGSQPV